MQEKDLSKIAMMEWIWWTWWFVKDFSQLKINPEDPITFSDGDWGV